MIPEGKGVLTDVEIAQDGFYTRTRDGAVSHLHRVSFDGKQSRAVATPFEGTVGVPVTDPQRPGTLVGIRGWLQSTRIMAYDAAKDRSDDTGLNPPSSIDHVWPTRPRKCSRTELRRHAHSAVHHPPQGPRDGRQPSRPSSKATAATACRSSPA